MELVTPLIERETTMHFRTTSLLRCGVTGTAVAALAFAVPVSATAVPAAPHGPENVIVLIGDGMGYNQIDAASLYEHGTANHQVSVDPAIGEVAEIPGTASQVFESFPVEVAMSTYAAGGSYDPQAAWSDFDYVTSGATDSAAAGTALATGSKTLNGALGVDSDGAELENLSERAISLGKAAGVVSSVPFSHATPAAYVAHNESRNNYHAIAAEMASSDMTVIMGAGHPKYTDSHEQRAPSYQYLSQDTWNALETGATGFELMDESSDFEALAASEQTPERVFGIAQVASTLQQSRAVDPGAAPFETPLNDVPDLATLTEGALNVLDDASDEGFFLSVEGGAIDWSGHANDTSRNIEETIDFNEAVESVVEWVETESSWKDTLVIVTADHETGYLAGPGADPTWTEMTGTAGQSPALSWNSGGHTNGLVPVFAQGAGAKELERLADSTDPVRGDYLDNTDLANLLLEDLWADGPGASAGNSNGRP